MSENLPFVFGDVLGGKYRIDRVIGRGGMAIVAELFEPQVGVCFGGASYTSP